ncbi:hypothetical protein H0H81_009247 [Sphagnurus paluster]|uniref:SnoaL-like domain-containing protein n=1 Tax=Sphagnurus paluster TaxID=117069 RepID=A0A9P7FS75_9AGAR|nr:hypothetical protein H0H81_009247 [Sphagnurus paluster]
MISNTNGSTYVPPEYPSPIIQTTLAFIQAYNEWDINKISAVYDDSLAHYLLPKSLGRPVVNKQEYLNNFENAVMPLFKRFHITVHEIAETVGDVVTIHASCLGESIFGAPYVNEYMVFLHFVPPKEGGDGLPKISMVKEFVDSSVMNKFFPEERAKLSAAMAAQKVGE